MAIEINNKTVEGARPALQTAGLQKVNMTQEA